MNDMIYTIWLALACTPGSATFPKLMKRFNTPKEIYEAEDKEISSAVGYRLSDRRALLKKDTTRATEIFNYCQRRGIGLLSYFDGAYPSSLRSIPTPPVLLYYRGVLPDFETEFFVSSVGTRRLSDYGRRNAFRISYDMSAAGAVIVSGMATGIDGVSHAGALSSGGKTIAVLGSGIDICYPDVHLKLAREIVKSGTVISEYPPGTKPYRINFPRRNRIISGLSSAVFAVEGDERSGAIITARHAEEQGRPVYTLPANVGSKNSILSVLLLKKGARVCTSAEDILSDFEEKYPHKINKFMLSERCPVDMMAALKAYSVDALCPNDDVFIPSKSKQRKEAVNNSKNARSSDKTVNVTRINEEANDKTELRENAVSAPPSDFDKTALLVYKRIPQTADISIEALVDEKISLREVMRSLLKLEMGNFIDRLPGDRVARKSR